MKTVLSACQERNATLGLQPSGRFPQGLRKDYVSSHETQRLLAEILSTMDASHVRDDDFVLGDHKVMHQWHLQQPLTCGTVQGKPLPDPWLGPMATSRQQESFGIFIEGRVTDTKLDRKAGCDRNLPHLM